ncbi:copper-binding protein [Pseudomonas brassicacearum]|uniref:Heat-shock protein HtpX n=1 Tax=Pseudomonas brassicacearum TaxID=930166 RepID=A0A423H103_9PSED|nr:copper-binding protein [Pseudomonas brassicacearum]RON05409.1 heat-shock protein HtpX [Pseudomonas brassicacearum]
MKLTLIAVASAVAALSISVQAEDMPGMKMDGMESMQMKQQTMQAPTANAEGTIKAVDTAKQTVTIAHGAVATLQWPPMTMTFKASPEQLGQVKVGDRVEFQFKAQGTVATLVAISIKK